MRRPASTGACLAKAALPEHDQLHGYKLFVTARRFYHSTCYGNSYLRYDHLGSRHLCEQIMKKRAKTSRRRKLFIHTRTPKRAFQANHYHHNFYSLATICASISLLSLCAVLLLSSTITTVAATTASQEPSELDQNHASVALALNRHHRHQLGERYSDGGGHHHHPNSHHHLIRRPVVREDRQAPSNYYDQKRRHGLKQKQRSNVINNRHTRHLQNTIGDAHDSGHKYRRHPIEKMQHHSNLELDSQSRPHERRHSFGDSPNAGRDLTVTSSPLNHFGRQLVADSEMDSYNLDGILNKLDSDDFDDDFDDDEDGDDDLDDDLDDLDGDDDDEDFDNSIDRLENSDDDDRLNRDFGLLDENRARFKQHATVHKFNRRQNLLDDQVHRLILARTGADDAERRHHVQGRRQFAASGHSHSYNHNQHHHLNQPHGRSNELDSSNDRPPAGSSNNLVPRRPMQPSPHVPYGQSPIVVSISDNSYVSASPLVSTKEENNFEQSTNYNGGGGSKTRDKISASTTVTSEIERGEFGNTSSSGYNGGDGGGGRSSVVDLDNTIWSRKPNVARRVGDKQVASNHIIEVYTAQPPEIVFSSFDRYHYSSDQESRTQTSSPLKRDQAQQDLVGDGNSRIEQPNRTTAKDRMGGKGDDRIRTDTIALNSDAEFDVDSSQQDSTTTTTSTIEPSWSTFMQASASDNYLSTDDDLNDDDDDATDTDNDDSDASAGASSADIADIANVHRSEGTNAKYSNLIIGPKNVVPSSLGRSYWHSPHLASIQMVQEDPNELNQGGINSAIIAMLFGIGATGMLIMVVGLKMRTIRERVAYKNRQRSLVPDTDFYINSIPIRSDTSHSLSKQTNPQS